MIACCLNIKPLESSEHGIFMIACCLNIKPLESSEHGIFMIACCTNIKPRSKYLKYSLKTKLCASKIKFVNIYTIIIIIIT